MKPKQKKSKPAPWTKMKGGIKPRKCKAKAKSEPKPRRQRPDGAQGRVGHTYNIGGASEKRNLDVVRALCAILDQERPRESGSYAQQISFVKDRPGHDRRYAIDASKITRDLGWQPAYTFERGIRETVQWYLDNQAWVNSVTSTK